MRQLQIDYHRFRACKKISYWKNYFDIIDDIQFRNEANRGRSTVILPFDSLGWSLHPRIQKEIAVIYSDGLLARLNSNLSWMMNRSKESGKVHLGYISYDFNRHPTGWMISGLLHNHNRKKYHISAFNYGKDDGSIYRNDIIAKSDNFYDLQSSGHLEIAALIHSKKVDILVDLQSYTRGSREDIVAYHPAGIVVSYLVYPGTTGASFIDYIIADKYVLPPEHAEYFSEKVVILPFSYQINDIQKPFFGIDDEACLKRRLKYGLPETAFVFANFNKPEKIDPQSFGVWMAIMQHVPNSVLWLLSSDKGVSSVKANENIRRNARSFGISGKRIGFAERLPKQEHLERIRVADLFLDNFIYGAHSTASDVLRLGVPVLTLCGPNFSSRVASSLLVNIFMPELQAHGTKEFQDLAIRIATNRTLHYNIREKLNRGVLKGHLFNTKKIALSIESAFQLMMELENISSTKTMHMILSRNVTVDE